MTARRCVDRLPAIGLALLLGACAPAAAMSPAYERLVAAHRQKAVELERSGDLRRALDEWKIALTLNPRDAAAREGRGRLQARLDGAVANRLRQGQEALRKGAPLEARRHFLAVLALDPGNKAAFEALREGVKEIRFVLHTVARGETLGAIAERYYGDRARAEVIWETNQLPPNPRLAPGSQLKIPEIAGIPFRPPEPRTAASARPEPAPPAPGPREPVREDVTTETNPLLVDTREALERKEYDVALTGVDKLLEGSPRNPEWLDLKKSILYEYGKESLDQKDYDDSYRAFSQLTKLDARYKDSAALLQEARTQTIQQHYSEGIRLYREEQIEAAIAHWRAVLEYDPQHGDARKNIEQAERILKALQERQRKQ
ncbi:MAG TPA: LysM peptidoglycan-binding domain-containing protein [Methylomirabilota bacterium]|nr:LysM peptidoglycan-binding domain-containing protein [Methylomirabilota bacterium]